MKKERSSSKELNSRKIGGGVAIRRLSNQSNLKAPSEQDRVLECVRQFLVSKGFTRTAEAFKAQRASTRGRPSREENRAMLVELFQRGRRQQFFQEWKRVFKHSQALNIEQLRKLEFQCQVYFYIYRVNPAARPEQLEAEVDQDAAAFINHYFKHSGNQFSKNLAFLNYYALPYLSRPQDNPAFQHLFSTEWVADLRSRIELQAAGRQGGRYDTVLENLMLGRTQKQRCSQQLRELQSKNSELSSLLQSVGQKYNQIKKNFLQFTDTSKSILVDSQRKWFQFAKELILVIKALADHADQLRRGGSLGSIEHLRPRIERYERLLSKNLDDLLTQDVSISVFDRPSYFTEVDQSVEPSRIQNRQSEKYLPFDFPKLTKHISEAILADRKAELAKLYRALRKSVLKQPARRQREIVFVYSLKDLCFLREGAEGERKYLLSQEGLRTEYVILVNLMISNSSCKLNYFLPAKGFKEMLFGVLEGEPGDTKARKAAVSALQKLSLVQRAQEPIAALGAIEWALGMLEREAETVSSYSIMFSTAMLCNLIMNSRLKERFIGSRGRLLRVSRLLLERQMRGEESQQYGYIIGIIYIAISWPPVKQEFIKQGLDQFIDRIYREAQARPVPPHQDEHSEMLRQLFHVLQRFQKEAPERVEESSIEEPAEDKVDEDLGSQEFEEDGSREEDFDDEVVLKQFFLVGPDSVLQQEAVRSLIEESARRADGRRDQMFGLGD